MESSLKACAPYCTGAIPVTTTLCNPAIMRSRNLKQEALILGLFESRAIDSDSTKALREFNANQAKEFRKSIARRDAAERKQEPVAFTRFMEKMENGTT